MSDDKLLAMAREAGALQSCSVWHMTDAELVRLEAAIRADEREKCALAVEGLFGGLSGKWGSENSDRYRAQDETRAMAAAAIRARGTP